MGEIISWDVVNEAIDDGERDLKQSFMGVIDDFICMAFKTADTVKKEQGWDDMLLFYNEHTFESENGPNHNRSEKVYSLMKNLTEN
jgi:GH35 family endo-1,4-beta-xylanase